MLVCKKKIIQPANVIYFLNLSKINNRFNNQDSYIYQCFNKKSSNNTEPKLVIVTAFCLKLFICYQSTIFALTNASINCSSVIFEAFRYNLLLSGTVTELPCPVKISSSWPGFLYNLTSAALIGNSSFLLPEICQYTT